MNYFFQSSHLSEGKSLKLSEDESRHAAKVLRLAKGDTIYIINGMGQLAEGEITGLTAKSIEVVIKNVKSEKKPSPQLSIGLAVLKKRDRLEWFIEKAVELAADKIIVFSSQHTEKDKAEPNRLNKIAISALKQSGNLWMPEIFGGVGFQEVVKGQYEGAKFIAHCREGEKGLLKDVYHSSQNTLILIGPEGDFSEGEVSQALAKGFIPVSLGSLRLRAETAALTALVTLQVMREG